MPVISEPDTFAQWIGSYCVRTDQLVPKAGTARRRLLASVYGALDAECVDVADQVRGMGCKPEVALAAVWITSALAR